MGSSKLDLQQLPGFIGGLAGEMDAAARIAGDEALKTARAWVITYVRNKKAVQPKRINQSMKSVKPRKGTHFSDMRWELAVRPIPMPMAAYPHQAEGGLKVGGGVRVEINKGKPVLVKHAFVATLKNGHSGIFVREPHAVSRPAPNKFGRTSLPIRELFTSTIADVLHDALAQQQIQEHSQQVYATTFARVMENGVAKNLAAKWASAATSKKR